MRLISCTIENFGKLNNVTYDFTNDCNTICEDNGWGKSTLASFIRVMFLDLRMKPRKNWWIRKETVLCLGRRVFMAEKLF